MNLNHLSWPFFAGVDGKFADEFDRWARRELTAFEGEDGGDGQAARRIFELLAASNWLEQTLPFASGYPQSKLAYMRLAGVKKFSAINISSLPMFQRGL